VASYFASICHQRLKALLARRFKGAQALALLGRIIDAGALAAAPHSAACGLPIGALTSQHFANAYLDGADRFLLARPEVRAHVRYMDDIVSWCDSRAAAEQGLQALRQHLLADWWLQLKPQVRIGRSARGIRFCGFRVRPGVVLPSARKMRRFRTGAKAMQAALKAGAATPQQAQRAHDVLASTPRTRKACVCASVCGLRQAATVRVCDGHRFQSRPTARCAAARGSTTPGTRVRPTATPTGATTATTTWAFACA